MRCLEPCHSTAAVFLLSVILKLFPVYFSVWFCCTPQLRKHKQKKSHFSGKYKCFFSAPQKVSYSLLTVYDTKTVLMSLSSSRFSRPGVLEVLKSLRIYFPLSENNETIKCVTKSGGKKLILCNHSDHSLCKHQCSESHPLPSLIPTLWPIEALPITQFKLLPSGKTSLNITVGPESKKGSLSSLASECICVCVCVSCVFGCREFRQ